MIRFIEGFIRYLLYRELYRNLRGVFGPVGLIVVGLALLMAAHGGFRLDSLAETLRRLF